MRDAAQYGEELLELIEQAIDGNLPRDEFQRLLRQSVYTSLESTFRRGAKIPPGDNLFPVERIALEGILTNHETNGYKYANAKDPDKNPVSISSRAFRLAAEI